MGRCFLLEKPMKGRSEGQEFLGFFLILKKKVIVVLAVISQLSQQTVFRRNSYIQMKQIHMKPFV